MSDLPLSVDLAGDTFVFAASAAPVRAAFLPPAPEAVRRRQPGRWLIWLIGSQIAASACLTTYVAYAMAPAIQRPLPDLATYALRLGAESSAPLPAAVHDGFRLRLSFHDATD
ncbi:hypothetical protein J2X36_005010 [Methylobacterium sp. BE186]|uniref:hypothetical protein n=1 Tax=Methylobacterium sp. BE186 TaxID=2817715 RepID=UPI00285638EC|nr:hypothetical protein [Methylobacterium sp. BE186]MDR7040228.1 hypothetical protein [Methylobacterium sp. BE186]